MAFLSTSFCSFKSYERKYHLYERSPFASVSMTALNYQATDRVRSLSKPKIRRETTIQDGRKRCSLNFSQSLIVGFSRYKSDPTYSGVTHAAAHSQCSSRLSDLALPLKRYKSVELELSLPRSVSNTALHYQPTERVNELALPRKQPGVR
jgi:hypothetical protein